MGQLVAISIPPLWQTYSAPGNSCSHAARVWAVRSGRASIRSLAGVDAEELRHPGDLPPEAQHRPVTVNQIAGDNRRGAWSQGLVESSAGATAFPPREPRQRRPGR